MLAALLAPDLPGQSGSRAFEEAVEPRECSESFLAAKPGFSLLTSLNLSLYLAGKSALCAGSQPAPGDSVSVQPGPLQAWGHNLCACSDCLCRPQTTEDGRAEGAGGRLE